MIPRLHRFYGPADPAYGSWWDVPARKFWAYVRMLPVLEARDRIASANQMAFAFGAMSKESAQSWIFTMRKMATLSGEDAPQVTRPSSPAMLAALSGGSTQVVMQPGPQTSSTRTPA